MHQIPLFPDNPDTLQDELFNAIHSYYRYEDLFSKAVDEYSGKNDLKEIEDLMLKMDNQKARIVECFFDCTKDINPDLKSKDFDLSPRFFDFVKRYAGYKK